MGKMKIKGQLNSCFDPKDDYLRFYLEKLKLFTFLLLYPFVLWFLLKAVYNYFLKKK